MQPVILVMEPDAALAELTRERLALKGMDATVFYDCRQALRTALAKEPDLLVCDIGHSNAEAIDFAEAVLQVVPGCRVLLTSGAPVASGEKLLSAYPERSAFLKKPFSMDVLLRSLEDLLLR